MVAAEEDLQDTENRLQEPGREIEGRLYDLDSQVHTLQGQIQTSEDIRREVSTENDRKDEEMKRLRNNLADMTEDKIAGDQANRELQANLQGAEKSKSKIEVQTITEEMNTVATGITSIQRSMNIASSSKRKSSPETDPGSPLKRSRPHR